MSLFFFFQAEDGIRDVAVTGVQTCALPISRIFPGILREIFRGGFYRFKFHKNLGRTVLDSQRGADAPVLQTIKSDCRAGRGHEMIWVWLLFGNEKTAKNQVILGVAAAETAGNSRDIEVREEYPLV